MLPKKYALNFFPTDLSGASRLPLTRLLVCFLSHLLYLLFLLFSPHCSSLHFSPLSLIPSVFQYSSVTWGFCLSTSLSLAPVGTMWQGEMGWGRVTQVNRLKSAGEAWGFIWCVRVCIRVGSRVGTSAQSYVSEVTPSVALIFPSVCCHFLSCPHQPSNSFCLRQKPLYIFAFSFIFLRFSFPAFLQLICAFYTKSPSQNHYHLPSHSPSAAFDSSFIPLLSFITLFYPIFFIPALLGSVSPQPIWSFSLLPSVSISLFSRHVIR